MGLGKKSFWVFLYLVIGVSLTFFSLSFNLEYFKNNIEIKAANSQVTSTEILRDLEDFILSDELAMSNIANIFNVTEKELEAFIPILIEDIKSEDITSRKVFESKIVSELDRLEKSIEGVLNINLEDSDKVEVSVILGDVYDKLLSDKDVLNEYLTVIDKVEKYYNLLISTKIKIIFISVIGILSLLIIMIKKSFREFVFGLTGSLYLTAIANSFIILFIEIGKTQIETITKLTVVINTKGFLSVVLICLVIGLILTIASGKQKKNQFEF